MKRSEMLLNIASELVHEYTNFMHFDKAQELAEIVLSRVEKEGMLPPSKHKAIEIQELQSEGLTQNHLFDLIKGFDWEPEELFSINPEEYEKWKKNE